MFVIHAFMIVVFIIAVIIMLSGEKESWTKYQKLNILILSSSMFASFVLLYYNEKVLENL